MMEYRAINARLRSLEADSKQNPGLMLWLVLLLLTCWAAMKVANLSERVDALEGKPPAVAKEAGK